MIELPQDKGLYAKCQSIIQSTLDSGSFDAIGYMSETLFPFIDNKIKSYKYTHCDLTKDELEILYKMNNVENAISISGGDILGIVDGKLDCIRRIDLFKIMEQIQWIKKNSKT